MNHPIPQIFDRQRAAAKWSRTRSRQRLGGASYLSKTIAEDILERLDFMRVSAENALVVGDTGTIRDHLPNATYEFLGDFDEEQPGNTAQHDLLIHLLGLGIVNDLPGALIHARHRLRDGGLFLAAFPGAGSLSTLRQIVLIADDDRPSARIHPQVDNRAGTALLERASFKRQVVDTYPIKVRYSSFATMINDLRDHGLTSSLLSPTPFLTRNWLERAQAAFDQMRDEDGKVTETFAILVLTGWR